MSVAGDLELLFPKSPTPGQFLRCLGEAMATGWEIDALGVWFLVWLEPMFSGALICCWIRPDKRRSRAARDATVAFHEWVFEATQIPVLIAVTKQQAIVTNVAKLGYRQFGAVDRLYGGETATFLALDGEAWRDGIKQG